MRDYANRAEKLRASKPRDRAQQAHEQKLQAAIAWLGDRWLLNPRCPVHQASAPSYMGKW